jgi:hypothetical protein
MGSTRIVSVHPFQAAPFIPNRALTRRSSPDYVAPMRLSSVVHHHAHERHVLRVGAVCV